MTKTGSILPEETLNAILRTGSNHNRTELRLIYNFMSKQKKNMKSLYGMNMEMEEKGLLLMEKSMRYGLTKMECRSHLVKQYAQKIRYIYRGSR